MMGFLERRFRNWGMRLAERDLRDFLGRLRSMDASEIGFVVACATDVRKELQAAGHDVLDPINCGALHPEIFTELGGTIRTFQKRGQLQDAAALMVWAHTLRAGSVGGPRIRALGREMWKELARGFPYVEMAATNYQAISGVILDIDGADQFPIGLTPEPL